MKNCDYQKKSHAKDIMQQLLQEKKKGKKSVYRSLTEEDLFILKENFDIKKQKIIIDTKRFYQVGKSSSHLLRSIHYAAKKKKRQIVENYSEEKCKLLKEYDIHYSIKCEIYL